MKIIQTFDSIGGENLKMGYPCRLAVKDQLVMSTEIHQQNYDIEIYADRAACDFLSSFLDSSIITETDFNRIDYRFWNASKLHTQSLQTEQYIHVDIDAVLYEPIIFEGIITEMLRSGQTMIEYQFCDLKPESKLICSGLLGFSDMIFKNFYISEAQNLIKNWPLRNVTFESLWTVEEILLTNLAHKHNINVTELDKNIFDHQQGSSKSITENFS